MEGDELFRRFGREFPAGTVLFREGEPGREMFVVQQGRVEIAALHVDRAGRLWIATSDGGAARLDSPDQSPLKMKRFGTAEGLSSHEVGAIAEDRDGRIYLGGGRGVDRVDPATDRVERLELDGDGRTKVVVLAGDGELPRHPGHDGFGSFVGHGLPPLGGVDADALVAGLEKSERFQGLDDATQELVRSLVREAAAGLPKMRHVEVRRLVEDGAASAE